MLNDTRYKTSSLRVLLGFLLLAFIGLLYLPLILKGGIIVDDWGDIAQSLGCTGFWACYGSWFPMFSNRPLEPLPITLFTFIFGLNIRYYLIANTTVFLAAIFLLALVVKKISNALTATTFVVFALMPVLAMPIVSSPINGSISNFSYLYWAISLVFLYLYCAPTIPKRNVVYYLASYFFLLCSWLTYEVHLPLVVINAFLPFLLDRDTLLKHPKRYLVQFISPLILVLLIVVGYQKIVAPLLFTVVHSRINLDVMKIQWSYRTWLDLFYLQLPSLFLKMKGHLSIYSIFTATLAATSLGLATYSLRTEKTGGLHLGFVGCSFLCFIACYLVFILSGATTVEGSGYDARFLSSSWIAFALVVSACAYVALRFSLWTLIPLGLLAFLCTLVFSISRDNYITSWQVQQNILSQALRLIEEKKVPQNAFILGNVPKYLEHNFNNEIIFSQPWDFGMALSIYTQNLIQGGAVIDARKGDFRNLKMNQGKLILDNYWQAPIERLWVFDFDPKTQLASLNAVSGPGDLQKQLILLGVPAYLGELGETSNVRKGEPLSFATDWFAWNRFLVNGWAARERWGVWSQAKQAQLRLPMPDDGASGIELRVNAFVSAPNPTQQIAVSVDGGEVHVLTLSLATDNVIRLKIPPSTLATPAKKVVTLDFSFPGAVSPKSLGLGADERDLSIGLISVNFL